MEDSNNETVNSNANENNAFDDIDNNDSTMNNNQTSIEKENKLESSEFEYVVKDNRAENQVKRKLHKIRVKTKNLRIGLGPKVAWDLKLEDEVIVKRKKRPKEEETNVDQVEEIKHEKVKKKKKSKKEKKKKQVNAETEIKTIDVVTNVGEVIENKDEVKQTNENKIVEIDKPKVNTKMQKFNIHKAKPESYKVYDVNALESSKENVVEKEITKFEFKKTPQDSQKSQKGKLCVISKFEIIIIIAALAFVYIVLAIALTVVYARSKS